MGELYDRALAERGFVVAAIDFRQAPCLQHPAGSADVTRAVRWIPRVCGPPRGRRLADRTNRLLERRPPGAAGRMQARRARAPSTGPRRGPATGARTAERLGAAAGDLAELTVYDGQSHGFGHRRGTATDAFVEDLSLFLARHLAVPAV
jgi:acetyl esterase/lipase